MVPARNAGATLADCLAGAAAAFADAASPFDAIVVDDGSSDATGEIARRAGARVLSAGGRGPGAARNAGWRATSADLVWFVDADCVPERESLRGLLGRLEADSELAAVGGSYSNLVPRSLLATMIHEEIVARHERMGTETDHLGSFHVLFHRSTLVASGGYDESRYNGPGRAAAEDLELSLRLRAAGHRLGFEIGSRVGHHHPTTLRRYLRSQAIHGFYATRVYLDRPSARGRSSYSGWLDHSQPPLAIVAFSAALASPFSGGARKIACAATIILFGLGVPTAARLAPARGKAALRSLYLVLSPLRAATRALGLASAVVDRWLPRRAR